MSEVAVQGPLWADRIGETGDVLILIHGLGANRAVWDPLLPFIREHWKGRCLIPDLAGHGRSPRRNGYSLGAFAADIAALVEPNQSIEIIGHSLGGAVGALLGTGWFGVDVGFLLALSVKLRWSAEEVAGARAVSVKPPRRFESRQAANDRYLKMSGLLPLAEKAERSVKEGVIERNGEYELSADTRIYGSASLGVDTLFRAARCPMAHLTGDNDPIAPQKDYAEFAFQAATVSGGHNIHMEQPAAIWSAFIAGRRRLA